MWKRVWTKFDRWCDRYLSLWLIAATSITLRLPSFSEPYWYGDEAIYLTIGHALRNGVRLYAEIVDHKTPLIYYAAMIGSQTGFRLLFTAVVIASGWMMWQLLRASGVRRWLSTIATLLFILTLNTPYLEGTIPNGEHLVMFWVLAALLLLSRSQLWQLIRSAHVQILRINLIRERKIFFGAGLLFSLAILTKVPALLELGLVGGILLTWMSAELVKNRKINQRVLIIGLNLGFIFGLGLILPILVSIFYYLLRGSGQAYLNFGLLYNFKYAGNWQPELQWWFAKFFYSLVGKLTIILGSLGLAISICRSRFVGLGLVNIWLAATIVAASLSNRPYPHYFLQVVPAAVFFIGIWGEHLSQLWNDRQRWISRQIISRFLIAQFWLILAVGSCVMAIKLLSISKYETPSYSRKLYQVLTGQLTWSEYHHLFNPIVTSNRTILPILSRAKPNQLYIWGTNPMLYAISDKYPLTRFIVSFHVKDIGAETETINQLQNNPPKYIVVMRDESLLQQLNELLATRYVLLYHDSYILLFRQLSL